MSLQGELAVKRGSQGAWQPAHLNDTFCRGDVIRVGGDSRASLALFNHTVLRLDQYTTLVLPEAPPSGGFWVELIDGVIHLISRVSTQLEIRTPYGTAGLEGTEFVLRVLERTTRLDVIEGQVALRNPDGLVRVGSGESALSPADRAPVLTVPVTTVDSVQWALHFPLLGGPAGQGDWLRSAQAALQLGHVDQARAHLTRAPADAVAQGAAQALLAVIAVVENRRAQALAHAKAAVRLQPFSGDGLLALSYAQQANHDLEAARDTVQKAVDLHPKNALLWARQAELALATGRPAAAGQAARRSVQLAPRTARGHTLMGFASLASGKVTAGLAAFDRAITLDSTDAMPRLGRGIALIRRGELAAGRRELEIAIGLAPANAVVRSYLGKAYDAENRTERARVQYALAKQLDPQDPTAYFYDALLLQATNRPVAAPRELKAALARNAKRGVYRSGLAADQDLAARNAAIARIYAELGFDQQADEAIASALSTDPADYAAHRFRADTLQADRHQALARASEVLQSQLLQPLNLYPVPPALAQSNLNILNHAGPQTIGINEYTPLFVRDQTVLQLSGVAGTDGLLGDEVLVGALQGDWALSAGQFHYQTDGFRQNSDVAEDIYTLFLQHRLSPATSVQVELRRHEQERGDVGLRFDPTAFSANRRENLQEDSIRLGIRHQLTGGGLLLGSVIRVDQSGDDASSAPLPSTPYVSTREHSYDNQGYLTEFQYLRPAPTGPWVMGGGYYENDVYDNIITRITLGPNVVATLPVLTDITETHANAYGYGYFDLHGQGQLVAGLSYDRLDSTPYAIDQFNPKLGLLWDLSARTRVRAAAFRTLQRSLVSDQTLEPTQVAGFTQFWDDPLGTDSRAVAAAIAHDIGADFSIGAKLIYRRLDVPIQGPEGEERHINRRGDAYVTWMPTARIAATTGYRFDGRRKRQSASVSANEPLALNTHSFPTRVSYHHPSGWFARLTQTYYRQDGRINTSTLTPPDTEKSRFWLTDAELGYRLPKRRGMVSLQVRNLFDRSFNFRDTDFAAGGTQAPEIQPARSTYLSLALPFN